MATAQTVKSRRTGSDTICMLRAKVSGRLITRMFAMALPAVCVAQVPPDEALSASRSILDDPSLIDRESLEAFLDPLVARCLDKFHVPGVVVVVVQDGQTVIAKGYGYADVGKKIPVDPDKTLFRVASVSKPFTATAVMQLAERGSLNLQDDVTTHVPRLSIQRSYSEPVTIAQLLTHTAGFDNSDIGDSARTPSEMMSLEQFLAERMSPQVFPPGTLKHYSNHGYALAGYVVEVVSGLPFATYMDENIFQPLGMQHSTFAQVLPLTLLADLAVGYEGHGPSFDPVPPDYSNMVPAGGLKTSGTDMARFMIAHLQVGGHRQAKILSEASLQEMHRQQFTHHPRLPGSAYGFSEDFLGDLRLLRHTGGTDGFSSEVILVPERRLGLFISSNTRRFKLGREVAARLLDRFVGSPPGTTPASPRDDFDGSVDRFVGTYRSTKYVRSTFEKMRVFGNPEYRLTKGSNGKLRFDGKRQLTQIDSFLFQSASGLLIAFREDHRGGVTHMLIKDFAFEKIAWYEAKIVQQILSGLLMAVILSALGFGPVGWIVRRLRRRTYHSPPKGRMARTIAGVVATLYLAFLVLLTGMALPTQPDLDFGVHPYYVVMLSIPLLAIPLTGAMIFFTVMAWKRHYWGRRGRIHYTLCTVAAVAYIPFLHYWNLLGYRF